MHLVIYVHVNYAWEQVESLSKPQDNGHEYKR